MANIRMGKVIALALSTLWRKNLPCIMPFEVGIFTKASNMET